MNSISSVFTNTQTFINMQQSANSQYVNINSAPTKIIGWMNAMSKYGDGVYVDATSSVL